MFITENQNVGDSVLFLMAARTSLSNIIEAKKEDNSKELISFIQNEASDYQIMNLLLHGTLPEEKYNVTAEAILFSDLKESMLINKDFVTEMVGEDIFDNVLNEVDSLYMTTSTQRPVLEFTAQTNMDVALACMIQEVSMPDPTGSQFKHPMLAKLNLLKTQAGKLSGDAKTAIMNKISALKASPAYQAALKKGAAAAKSVQGAATKAGTAITKFSGTKAGLATGGAAAAALAIYAGYKIYKRFFSQAAKACAGKSGKEKTACMNKYKKTALMKQASAIQSGVSKCAKSKDPAKCKAALSKKVASIKAKAAKIAA